MTNDDEVIHVAFEFDLKRRAATAGIRPRFLELARKKEGSYVRDIVQWEYQAFKRGWLAHQFPNIDESLCQS